MILFTFCSWDLACKSQKEKRKIHTKPSFIFSFFSNNIKIYLIFNSKNIKGLGSFSLPLSSENYTFSNLKIENTNRYKFSEQELNICNTNI